MILLTLQIMAAGYLLIFPWTLNTHNLTGAIFFQAAPSLIGVGLAFFTVARFMGRPV